jgi:hypothetical protein
MLLPQVLQKPRLAPGEESNQVRHFAPWSSEKWLESNPTQVTYPAPCALRHMLQ